MFALFYGYPAIYGYIFKAWIKNWIFSITTTSLLLMVSAGNLGGMGHEKSYGASSYTYVLLYCKIRTTCFLLAENPGRKLKKIAASR